MFSYLLNLFISTYFVCLIADMSENLVLVDFVKNYLSGDSYAAPAKKNNKSFGSRAKSSAARRGFAESNVNEGYDIVPTRPY